MDKINNYTSEIIESLFLEITEKELNETEKNMKFETALLFAEKYNLILYDCISSDVFDFKQYVFTFKEMCFAIDNDIPFDELINMQQKIIDNRDDIDKIIKFKKIINNYLKMENKLIEILKSAKTDIHATNFTKYIWFQFTTGRFLYNDQFVNYDYIEPLIASKQLIFKKIDNHQGEKMAQYIVAE